MVSGIGCWFHYSNYSLLTNNIKNMQTSMLSFKYLFANVFSIKNKLFPFYYMLLSYLFYT